jgi:hypothetical protein
MAEDIPLYDNSEGGNPYDKMPKRPPSDARVTDYRVMPWPDGTRVTIEMGLTPFKEFPSIDISVTTEAGELIKLTSMVGAMERRPAPTLWLPRGIPKGLPLIALIEVLGDEAPLQTVRVPFAVAGPIIKQAVEGYE